MAQLTPADRTIINEALTPAASTYRLSRSIEATMDPTAVTPPNMLDRVEPMAVDNEHAGDGHLPPDAQHVAARPRGNLPQPTASRPWTEEEGQKYLVLHMQQLNHLGINPWANSK